MAPMPLENVEDRIKDVIQDLFEIQSTVHSYLGPESRDELVHKVTQLSTSLSDLAKSSSAITTQIPPEIVEYVDEGRNPDIYTREFVELVQRGNQELKGKSEAFASFRDVLGEEIRTAMPELESDVARILSGGPVEKVKENSEIG